MPSQGADELAAVRLARARAALEGLSVGDAFGERFFVDYTVVERLIEERAEPVAPWTYADDTEMALSILATLIEHGRIDRTGRHPTELAGRPRAATALGIRLIGRAPGRVRAQAHLRTLPPRSAGGVRGSTAIGRAPRGSIRPKR